MITITKNKFEGFVPAFANATSEIFDSIQGFIELAKIEIAQLTGEQFNDISENLTECIERLVCLTAARHALPSLDLVLTPTGFGVVSNQNVAPASRERVAALAESLRRDESNKRDLLLFDLLNTDWADTAMARERVSSLLWNPMLCRRYGVKTKDEHEIYAEEYDELKPSISMAEPHVTNIISLELYRALVERQRTNYASDDAEYMYLREKVRKFMAVVIMMPNNKRAIAKLGAELLHIVRRYEFPEYNGSSTALAHEFPRYENKKEDRTFFFG